MVYVRSPKETKFVYKFKNIGYRVSISNLRVDSVIRYDVLIEDLETSVKTEHSSFCYIQKHNVSGCKTSISQCIEYAISKHVKSVNFDKMIWVIIEDKDKYDFVEKLINDLKEIKTNGVKVLCEGVDEYGK